MQGKYAEQSLVEGGLEILTLSTKGLFKGSQLTGRVTRGFYLKLLLNKKPTGFP